LADYWPIRFHALKAVVVLDQTLLPHEERYLELKTVEAMCEAIRALRVRGAPLLGLCGAAGVAIAATERGTSDAALHAAADELRTTRPTAVDLGAGIDEALAFALTAGDVEREIALWNHAEAMLERQRARDAALAEQGAALFAGGAVLTHCNTGALATGGSGTALAVIHRAWKQGRVSRCFATETRPLLQGARLTAWELKKLGIPATLLPDTAAASLIASGEIAAVMTGADRIAANGDTANKVGTYGLAAVAYRHGIPFYIAAPTSTIDPGCPSGGAIPIEFRAPSEVGGFGGQRWAVDGIEAYNPAFDVTPAELIAAIVTEAGVHRPPYRVSLPALGPPR
jgi:methylthioribose-1-phosphate isomerase